MRPIRPVDRVLEGPRRVSDLADADLDVVLIIEAKGRVITDTRFADREIDTLRQQVALVHDAELAEVRDAADLSDVAQDALLKTVEETRIGPGIDPVTQMGPLVSKTQMERVLGYIAVGNQEGARLMAGGGRPEGLDGGYFVKPTVFADVDGKMRIAREEIFGPVVSAIPFQDEEDLVAKANDTMYGLVAGVWTKDVARAHRVAHALKAGTVYVNCYHVVDPVTPWGGFKQSGWGRELGPYALDLYTELKNVIVDIA